MTIHRHSETAFEQVVENHVLQNGYIKVSSSFDRARAIFPDEAINFIRTTQQKEWAKLEALHGDNTATQVLT